MRHDILDQIPPTILQRVRRHLEVIHDFNAEGCSVPVTWSGGSGAQAATNGDTVWPTKPRPRPAPPGSLRFAAQAATLGIDAQTVYDTLGTTPTLLPWSDAAHQWRTP